MKAVLLFFTILAVANCGFVRNPYNNIRYIPRLPKVNGKEVEHIDPLIVGGSEAVPHSRPFQAALYIKVGDLYYFCGGTLISPEWVFTAAHCTTGSSQVEIILGAHDTSVAESTQKVVFASGGNIHTHEAFNPDTLSNDVSLLHFDSGAISYTNEIQAAPLPNSGDADLGAGLQVVVSGWGATNDDGGSTSKLKVATVPTMSNDACASYYVAGLVTGNTLCTDSTSGTGTCFGDSGGPLTYDFGGGPVHRAVVSFVSSAGCLSGGPDGFTRTSHFRDWIRQISGI